MTFAARALVAAIELYRRFISPLLPRHCRYEPTCSAYAIEALKVHGAMKGTALAVRRVARCHPFHPGGVDHVPAPRGSNGKVA